MKGANAYSYSYGDKFRRKSAKEIFSDAKENIWQKTESVSGIGPSLAQTKEITIKFPSVLKEFKISSIN